MTQNKILVYKNKLDVLNKITNALNNKSKSQRGIIEFKVSKNV